MSTFVDFSGRFLLPVLFAELCKKSVESRKNRVNKEFTSYRCSFIVVKTLSLSRFCRDLAIFGISSKSRALEIRIILKSGRVKTR